MSNDREKRFPRQIDKRTYGGYPYEITKGNQMNI